MKKGTGIFGTQFALRTAKGEIERWLKAAHKVGMNRAVWMRSVLNKEAEKILESKR